MTAKIKLNAASGGGSVSIVAPTSTTSNANVELKLPIADGSSDQVIKTDGSGNLSFGKGTTAKNLLINGGFTVAQRGVASTVSGYGCVDRWQVAHAGADEAPTQSLADVASGTTPYSLGHRFALRATNGNQTGGADAGDFIFMFQTIEAQDIAYSGWNYKDSNSFVTLSFWVKSSVAQNFYGYLTSYDGTGQRYAFETGSLTANTWTKITKTIPGNTDLVFDNNYDAGLLVLISPFTGTNYTDSGVTLGQWGTYASGDRMPDFTSTWWATNDATFEITGAQLEVGSSASTFAHETYAETLLKCQRYYQIAINSGNSGKSFMNLAQYSASDSYGHLQFATTMRASPALEIVTGTNYYGAFGNAGVNYVNTIIMTSAHQNGAEMNGATSRGQGNAVWFRTNNANAQIAFSAEL